MCPSVGRSVSPSIMLSLFGLLGATIVVAADVAPSVSGGLSLSVLSCHSSSVCQNVSIFTCLSLSAAVFLLAAIFQRIFFVLLLLHVDI